jgi:hypothetical protein
MEYGNAVTELRIMNYIAVDFCTGDENMGNDNSYRLQLYVK